MKILIRYFKIPLITRLILAFLFGAACGWLLWQFSPFEGTAVFLNTYVAPFGQVFVNMLKMVVVPIVLFSLITGAANLPVTKLPKTGLKLLFLYLLTSILATIVGIIVAFIVNPGAGTSQMWQEQLAESGGIKANLTPVTNHGLIKIILEMFDNPFTSLAQSNFLGIIFFSVMFGLALSSIREQTKHPQNANVLNFLGIIEAINAALHKAVRWIMEYAPVGVFALSVTNFGNYGSNIVGPYVRVVCGVILGITLMIFGIYSFMIRFIAKENPLDFFKKIREPMVTAFATRSSAAALPISLQTAEQIGISREIASFALPLGSTINMNGVCVHLPMFAILAINMFEIPFGFTDTLVLIISTVLAAIGTGGVPGGSLMLLFIVLGSLGVSESQTAAVVSLALGVNPVIDMFETTNNVTGDLICAYLVERKKPPLV